MHLHTGTAEEVIQELNPFPDHIKTVRFHIRTIMFSHWHFTHFHYVVKL